GDPGAPALEDVAAELRHARGRHAVGAAPVGPRRDRRVRRIADRLERGNAAVLHLVAPVVVEIGEERLHVRHARMDVAIDGVKVRHRGPSALMFAALAMSAQRAVSLRIQASSSSGLLPPGKIPRCRVLAANSAEPTTARTSSDSLCSTGRGTPAGATMALKAMTSKPAKVSAMAGTCGASARRSAPAPAISLSSPDST